MVGLVGLSTPPLVASNLFFLPFPRFHGAWAAAICTEVLVFLIKEENNGKSLGMHYCYSVAVQDPIMAKPRKKWYKNCFGTIKIRKNC